MSNSLFGDEDPWKSDWSSGFERGSNNNLSNTGFGFGDPFLSGSRALDAGDADNINYQDFEFPESYSSAYSRFKETGDEFRVREYLDRLVRNVIISESQGNRLYDTILDSGSSIISDKTTFQEIIGLIALEIADPGTGDLRTLEFRSHNLPELPSNALELIVPNSVIQDPLSAALEATPTGNSMVKSPLKDSTISDNVPSHEIQDMLASPSKIPSDSDAKVDIPEVSKYITNIRNKFTPLYGAKDLIMIKEIPQKEGVVFKHTNYLISHDIKTGMHVPMGIKKVVRRYSDFVWLLEVLIKKYPFRIIPGLPPKKFTVGSSPDSQFLQRRRRGLHRFLNQLIKHPVLKTDPIVITFLTVPTDMNTWKKQAKVDYSLEFKGQRIDSKFIGTIWPHVGSDFMTKWGTCSENLPKIIQVWTKVVILIERYEKRQQQIALDNDRFAEVFSRLRSLDDSIYPHKDDDSLISKENKDDTSQINDSLGTFIEYLNKSSQELIDDSFSINTSVLEKCKNYLDYLYSFQEMIDRYKVLSSNTIPVIQKRLQENEAKFVKINSDDADIKGSELAKLKQAIANDKQDIFQQLNQDWLMKSCIFEEFLIFQETQYLISELWIEWCKGRLSFQEHSELLIDNITNEITNGMPTHR